MFKKWITDKFTPKLDTMSYIHIRMLQRQIEETIRDMDYATSKFKESLDNKK